MLWGNLVPLHSDQISFKYIIECLLLKYHPVKKQLVIRKREVITVIIKL